MVEDQDGRAGIDADTIAETGLEVLGTDIVGQGFETVGDIAAQQVPAKIQQLPAKMRERRKPVMISLAVLGAWMLRRRRRRRKEE